MVLVAAMSVNSIVTRAQAATGACVSLRRFRRDATTECSADAVLGRSESKTCAMLGAERAQSQ
ncbi:hypothetical protein CQW49_20600 [Methylosinus trichosporium OB3b]|uniref:Uncharacterized protein n=1 Tax=Methylosinus trichosporium (strain ATCC 35070 / NCIMB 11131 / UNIQEM 75 / OB3b) TaxID=595536 RepID=A0A2D2D4S7_METT3|nr:hypothetical protein CQW49_20600 [Methylosinus trichosporium OB3b]OBS50403.1 hypothetical protein A8B73_21675 [Methylosinus sp. 3S-1]